MNMRRIWQKLLAQEDTDALESERMRRDRDGAPAGQAGAALGNGQRVDEAADGEQAGRASEGRAEDGWVARQSTHTNEASGSGPDGRAEEASGNGQADRAEDGSAALQAQYVNEGKSARETGGAGESQVNGRALRAGKAQPARQAQYTNEAQSARQAQYNNEGQTTRLTGSGENSPDDEPVSRALSASAAWLGAAGARARRMASALRKRGADRRKRRRARRARKRAELKAMTPEQRARYRGLRRKRAGLWALGIAGAGVAALLLVLDVGSWTWLDESLLTELRQTTLMYDGNGVEVANMYLGENRLPVDASTLPEHVRMAFVSAEDARFYSHHGIDLWRIGGAVVQDIKSGGYAQGASTISQQLIKLTHLTAEKTLARKANEAVLALVMESRYSKDEILGMYMNTVYFGHGAYGIEAAARAYFSKSASELTIAEGALMAAVIKSPSGYAPHIAPDKARKRRDWVLSEMARLGYISQAECDAAQETAIELNESHERLPEYGWYIDYALAEAEQLLGLAPDELLAGGYRIYTALDAALQAEAQRRFATGEFPSDSADGTQCQGALCAVKNGTGEILALVGGREYEVRRGLNRAADVRRQPGSAIKPLAVYAPAVDKFGYLPTSFLSDVPTDFGGWSPRNAGDRYRGIVTLRQTAMSSINVATVELLSRIGVKAGVDFLHSAGIATDPRDEVLPLALGAMTYGVSPLELCGAYSALGSGGVYTQPYAVRYILDAQGRAVYSHDGGARRVMSEQSAYIVTSMLKSTAAKGTASRLSALGAEVAAKTGTAALNQAESGVSGNRDIWLAAYTPDISVSVWMGFDRTDSKHYLPSSASGSNQPAKLVLALLSSAAASQYTDGAFTRPAGLREVMIDGWALDNLHSVLLAGEATPAGELMREVFTSGTLPSGVSTLFDEPLPTYDVSATRDESGRVRIEFTCPQEYVQYRVYRDAGAGRMLVGTLAGTEGQRLALTDTDAPDAVSVRYDVVPYAPAQDAEGLATSVVLERTLWDELGRWFGGGARQATSAPPLTPEPTTAPAATPTAAPTMPPVDTAMPMQTTEPAAPEGGEDEADWDERYDETVRGGEDARSVGNPFAIG